MPAPVRSRSAFTSPAEICAASISAHLLVGSRGAFAFLGRLHVSFLFTARTVQMLPIPLLFALDVLHDLARRRRLPRLGLGLLARRLGLHVVLGATRPRRRVRAARQRGSPPSAGAGGCRVRGALGLLGRRALLGLAALALGGLAGCLLLRLAT